MGVGVSVMGCISGKTLRNLKPTPLSNDKYGEDINKVALGFESYNSAKLTIQSMEAARAANNLLDSLLVINRINSILNNPPANFPVAETMVALMKNTAYKALIDDVSDVFGSIANVFFTNAYLTGNLADFRFSTLAVYYLDRQRGEVLTPRGTLFGQGVVTDNTLEEMTQMERIIDMAAMLALSQDSPVIDTATGIILNRRLMARQTGTAQYANEDDRDDIQWTSDMIVVRQDEHVSETVFTIPLAEPVVIRDPCDPRLGEYVLVIQDQNSVLNFQRSFLVTAIVYGQLAVRFPNQRYSYIIEYVVNPAAMHTTHDQMYKIVYSLFVQPRSSYPMLKFLDNTHARIETTRIIEPTLNYRVVHHVAAVRAPIVGAGIYAQGTAGNQNIPPPDYVPLDVNNMCFGTRSLLNPLNPNGAAKLGAQFNTNNTMTIKYVIDPVNEIIPTSVVAAGL